MLLKREYIRNSFYRLCALSSIDFLVITPFITYTLGKIGSKKVVEGAFPYIDLCLRGNFNIPSRREFSRTKEGFNRLCDLQWTQTR